MKKAFWAIIVAGVLGITVISTGCGSGITQEELDAVTAERQAAESELEQAKTSLESSQAELEKTQSELEKVTADLESVQSEYAEYKESMSEYEELSEKEAEARKIEAEKTAQQAKEEAEAKAAEEAAAREEEEKKGYDTGITYDQLARTPDDYNGKKVKFYGRVVQVIEGDETQIRLAVDDDYDNILLGGYDKGIVSSRVLEDDMITIYGTSVGLISYESTMGGTITIPGVYIDKIDQ